MTHTLRILDSTGDTEITWDPADAATVSEARKWFDKVTKGTGRVAYKAAPGESEVIKAFDPTAAEIVVAAKLVGG